MNHTPEALQLARELDTKAQALGCPLDRFSDALRHQHTRIAELEAENKSLRALASGGIDLFERYSTFKAKCAELEAMLDAVGAGGVGQSIKPPVQDDTAQKPVAWMYERNGRTHITNTDQRPIEHAHPHFKKSKPLYTAPNPARQPLTDEQILSIVRVAPALDTAEAEFLHIARAVEFAHGITGGQP